MKTSVCVLQKFFLLLNVLQVKFYKIFFCFFLFFFLTSFVSAQTSNQEINKNTGKDVESQYTFSQNFPANTDNDELNVNDSPSTIWLFIRMILVLIVVIACIYFVVFLMKKGMNNGVSSDLYLKKVATLTLSPGKNVTVVTLNNHAYLLGVADNSINLIAEIDDKELIDAMNFNESSTMSSNKTNDFASILQFFYPKNKSKNKQSSNLGFSEDETLQVLQKQRERLNNSNDYEEEIKDEL